MIGIFYKRLGKRIKELRLEKGLTQAELSEKVSINENYLSRVETAQRVPSLNTVVKLAKALDVEPYELLKFNSK